MAASSYDTLYENLKNRYTVVNDGSEYTLGEFMLMKAKKKSDEPVAKSSKLPVAVKSKSERAVAQIVSFVNDKLTIKKPPVKDKTIRAFPIRASFSAFLSAAVACSFILCFCVVGAKLLKVNTPVSGEASITECAPEIEAEVLNA
jgi:hypothetical protein